MSDTVAAGTARRSQPAATGVFDLRRWLEKAKAIGQLKDAEGADLKFELGCITDLNAKRGGPALLFKHFKGYGDGFRVQTGSMMNAATLGLTMGFEGALSDLEVVEKVAEPFDCTPGEGVTPGDLRWPGREASGPFDPPDPSSR